jgi:hypothetical protein
MTPKTNDHEDPTAVWVRHKQTGTMFQAGLANVAELGDDYETIKSPDDPTPVGVKTRVKEAVKAQEEAAEAGVDGQE